MTHIKICTGCFTDPDHALQSVLDRYAAIEVEYVECLEICENEPVIAVDDIILAPATPSQLSEAIASSNGGQAGE